MRICQRALAPALALAFFLAGCGAAPAPAPQPAAAPAAPTPAPTPENWDATCALYLQVLEDLWAADPALDSGITTLGLDVSTAPGGLSGAQQDELAARFGAAHGLPVVQATWQELADAGAIDAENLLWEEGCLYSIRASEGLPAGGEGGTGGDALCFTAEKWRSGLGAYLFCDCVARYADGAWQYTVGAEAIA